MLKYIIKRILYLIPILIGVLLLLFILSELTPGDAADALLPADTTFEQKEAWREANGLNDPFLIRFFRYAAGAFTGDLGTSYKTHQPVLTEIMQRLPYSLLVSFCAVIFGVLIGVPLGVVSAIKAYTWIDNALIVFSMMMLSLPMFCLGLFSIFIFSVQLNWLPAFGVDTWKGFIMPIGVVAIASSVSYIRVARTTMLEAMRQDYVMTARAKGQHERIVVFKHMLRNALIPIVAQIGGDIGANLGGAMILETVFGVPGIGKYIADNITARNYPSVLGGVFVLAMMVTIVNLLVDLAYTVVDPRLKTSIITTGSIRKSRKLAAKGGVPANG